MEIKEAIKILKRHNKWRRYNGDIDKSPEMISPKNIGVAIDTVIEYHKSTSHIYMKGFEEGANSASNDILREI